MATPRALRELMSISSQYELDYVGQTKRGHYRWLHRPTGRTVVTVSHLTSYSALKNAERTIRLSIRNFTNAGHPHQNRRERPTAH